jgi:hypothetical protein
VGIGGTYNKEPAAGMVLFKQLLVFKISVVVLYLSAMVYSVSFVLTTIRTQPIGGLHTTGAARVALGSAVSDAVNVGIPSISVGAMMGVGLDCSSDVAMMIGNGVEVGCSGALVSASASEMPPTTNSNEMMAITSPPPI